MEAVFPPRELPSSAELQCQQRQKCGGEILSGIEPKQPTCSHSEPFTPHTGPSSFHPMILNTCYRTLPVTSVIQPAHSHLLLEEDWKPKLGEMGLPVHWGAIQLGTVQLVSASLSPGSLSVCG